MPLPCGGSVQHGAMVKQMSQSPLNRVVNKALQNVQNQQGQVAFWFGVENLWKWLENTT